MHLDAWIVVKFLLIVLIVLLVIFEVGGCWYLYNKRLNQRKQLRNKRLLLRNYNPQGGFWWMMYNVLLACRFAQENEMSIIVCFDSGLYLDPTGTNWFNYYFNPLGSEEEAVAFMQQQYIPSVAAYKEHSYSHIFEFDHKAYQTMVDQSDTNFELIWEQHMRLKSDIQAKIDAFADQHFANKVVISMHNRLTDKFGNKQDAENDPLHLPISYPCTLVRRWIESTSCSNYVIFVCSDEWPFIEHVVNEFGAERVCYTDSTRSSINSSGLTLNSHLCDDNNPESYQLPDCQVYKQMIQHSIHRNQNYKGSRRKLGEEALIEVMLITLYSTIFFKSQGNFSNAPSWIKPSLKTISMVDCYRSELSG